MSNRLTLRAYWKPRRESAEQCADRLFAFMRDLTECDDVFARWFELGRSRKDALKSEIDVHSRQALFTLIDKARNRNFYKEVIEDLGFHPCAWNGGESGKEVGLRIRCGHYSEAPGLGSNNVLVDFPEDLGDLADSAKSSQVLSVVVACWEPDRGEIVSSELKGVGASAEWHYAKWIVYIPRRIVSVPPPSTVTQLENGGSLIVVQPSPPSVDDPEDQERIRRIEEVVRP